MGQGYSQAGTFWCVLNVSLHSSGGQLGLDFVDRGKASGIVGPGNSSSIYILGCSQVLKKNANCRLEKDFHSPLAE